jgi:hypothetical protein
LYLLQKGGYRFGADELDVEDRLMLGAIEIALRRREIAEALKMIFGAEEEL